MQKNAMPHTLEKTLRETVHRLTDETIDLRAALEDMADDMSAKTNALHEELGEAFEILDQACDIMSTLAKYAARNSCEAVIVSVATQAFEFIRAQKRGIQ